MTEFRATKASTAACQKWQLCPSCLKIDDASCQCIHNLSSETVGSFSLQLISSQHLLCKTTGTPSGKNIEHRLVGNNFHRPSSMGEWVSEKGLTSHQHKIGYIETR